jgi:hypothetical protein
VASKLPAKWKRWDRVRVVGGREAGLEGTLEVIPTGYVLVRGAGVEGQETVHLVEIKHVENDAGERRR